jgi:hypothetical protein
MQSRELGVVAILCPLTTLALAALLALFDLQTTIDFTERFRRTLPMSICLMGMLFTTVLGAGVFLRDVEPGLNAFWRSRPTNPSQWFWTKYLSGFVIWLVAIGIPVGILGALQSTWDFFSHPDLEGILLIATSGLAIFASSLAAMCLVRQPVYACLLSLGLVLTSLGVIFANYEHLSTDILSVIAAALMIAVTVISTLLAWLAVRNDWGWRS